MLEQSDDLRVGARELARKTVESGVDVVESGNSTVNPIELAVSGVDENSPTIANTHENA